MILKIQLFLTSFILIAISTSNAIAQIDCGPLKPTPPKDISTEISGKINARTSGIVSRIGGADASIDGTFKEVSTNILSEFPNSDRLYLWNLTIYFNCEVLRESKTLSDGQKLDVIEKLFERIDKPPRNLSGLPDTKLKDTKYTSLEPSPPRTLCDRLTANEDDSDSVAQGIDFTQIDHKSAIPECNKSISQFGEIRRFVYQLARSYDSAKDCPNTLLNYKRAALLGSAISYRTLGLIYRNSECGTNDREASFAYFKKSAELYNVTAMVDLGLSYEKGLGVQRDQHQACSWWQAAAEAGNRIAMRNVAVCYDEGGKKDRPGTYPRNFAKSAHWILESFKRGHPTAFRELFFQYGAWDIQTRAMIQSILKSKGFYWGKTDGIFDNDTFDALKKLKMTEGD